MHLTFVRSSATKPVSSLSSSLTSRKEETELAPGVRLTTVGFDNVEGAGFCPIVALRCGIPSETAARGRTVDVAVEVDVAFVVGDTTLFRGAVGGLFASAGGDLLAASPDRGGLGGADVLLAA